MSGAWILFAFCAPEASIRGVIEWCYIFSKLKRVSLEWIGMTELERKSRKKLLRCKRANIASSF